MSNKKTSSSQPVKTKATEIWLDHDSVVCVRILENAEMDEDAFKECFAVYRQLLLPGQQALQLIDARAICNITLEGKEYSALNSSELFSATAVITDNLSVKLLINFFNKYHKHPVPFKLFATEEEARIWLNSYKT